ncbi:phage tail protein [Sphingomonas immobilis]|uniref:Tail fiber protein n=1 Tax=Sphingomonas immobilis TaxID=3063997 RepID=A0ABT8ZZZ7_9SPHN|nr:tail fiber protein [Sphingomonas sp. CA1-15]MDO7843144.1 tail fiber protein [Sphingomonas sp. CA1-15]
MSNPFLGEIKLWACNFAPRGWALCQGQILPISTNTALFSLLGTTYGGNGQTTFALPNLAGRTAAGPASGGGNLGQQEGVEAVALALSELPAHSHRLTGTSNAGAVQKAPSNPTPALFGPDNSAASDFYAADTNPLVAIAGASMTTQGGSQPHNNMQPYLVLNYCIAVSGIFPSRN